MKEVRAISSILTVAQGVGVAAKEATRAGLDRVLPGGEAIPVRASGVTAEWLAGAIGVPAGAIRSVRILDEHSGTAARARIAVDADADVPDHLFVKFAPHNFLQQVMMNVFRLGAREVLAYRTLGDTAPVRVPRCYGTKVDDLRGRNIMVLEDLSETATFRTVLDSVTAPEAAAVVDALADLHIAFSGQPLPEALQPLTARSAGVNALGAIVRRRFIGNMKGQAADLVPDAMKGPCRILFERSDDIDALWAAQPQTLLHGDPHLGNLFFERARPGFLDWQVASAGPGIREIAYFATASVAPELLRTIERDLIDRYAARLDAAGIPVDIDRMWTLYRAGSSAFFGSAVAASEAGERAQPPDITRAGVERAVAAAETHDTFGVLAALVDGKRV